MASRPWRYSSISLRQKNNTINHVHGLGLIFSRQTSKFLENYSDNVKHLKDRFFLVTPLNKEAHAKICKIEHDPHIFVHIYSTNSGGRITYG